MTRLTSWFTRQKPKRSKIKNHIDGLTFSQVAGEINFLLCWDNCTSAGIYSKHRSIQGGSFDILSQENQLICGRFVYFTKCLHRKQAFGPFCLKLSPHLRGCISLSDSICGWIRNHAWFWTWELRESRNSPMFDRGWMGLPFAQFLLSHKAVNCQTGNRSIYIITWAILPFPQLERLVKSCTKTSRESCDNYWTSRVNYFCLFS